MPHKSAHDDPHRFISHGTVTQRVRTLLDRASDPAPTQVPAQPDLTPARLKPEAVGFLQNEEDKRSPKGTLGPGKAFSLFDLLLAS
jgi:hypothetical protein